MVRLLTKKATAIAYRFDRKTDEWKLAWCETNKDTLTNLVTQAIVSPAAVVLRDTFINMWNPAWTEVNRTLPDSFTCSTTSQTNKKRRTSIPTLNNVKD